MATMVAPQALDVREAILRSLRENERQPMQLLTELGQHFVDSEIKQAMSELIREGAIELTSHRILRVPAHP